MSLQDELRRRVDADPRTAKQICQDAGVNEFMIRDILSGRVQNPRRDSLAKLAAALKCTVNDLLGDASQTSGLRRIALRGAVEAGAWRESAEWPHAEWVEMPIYDDPRFPGLPLYALEVRRSDLFEAGTVVVCIDFADLKREPRKGDIVVCRRQRDGLVETTVQAFSTGSAAEVVALVVMDIRLRPIF